MLGAPAQSELSVAVVGERSMRSLSKRYRKDGHVATVLSFPFLPFRTWHKSAYNTVFSSLIGEIVLCPAAARRYSRITGISFQGALDSLLVHGIVHIAGYDHKTSKDTTKMERIEKDILQKANRTHS